ncbi:MAG: hypothetical protein ISR85_05810 [Kiritimatiellales bacterium]|nr:hypothetical protein [Kiritimatiellota bacterium]MBL7012426.1 hypothetical protein [Kiritimatiellales bacterium]
MKPLETGQFLATQTRTFDRTFQGVSAGLIQTLKTKFYTVSLFLRQYLSKTFPKVPPPA